MGLLLIDVGRGTQDILLYRAGQPWENNVQMILPSPTALLAEQVRVATVAGSDLVFIGETMGGGPLTKAVRSHIEAGRAVWATHRASATFDDDPAEVRSMGVKVVEEGEVPGLVAAGVRIIAAADVDLAMLEASLSAWGIPFKVDAVAVAVQDHGSGPPGMSDRRFRFARFRERLDADSRLSGLAYTAEDLPSYLTRMQGVKRSLEGAGKLLFMDTGFAALLGAMADPAVGRSGTRLILNVGNGHTLAGLVEGENLLALFEHHTRRLTVEKLGSLLDQLVSGEIDDMDVYRSGGHGAFVRSGVSFPRWEGVETFAATGPRRSLASDLPRPPYLAAPYGQMMLTGNCGLFRAFEVSYGEYSGGFE